MSIIDKAVDFAVSIAEDDTHGYDQANRWGPDYDCSSLLIEAWERAGVPVKTKGATYTGDMKKVFIACGFVEVPLKDRQRGDVLLNEAQHCAMMVDSKNLVNASINELGKAVGGKRGDQTKKEILVRPYYTYSKGWDCCLRYVGTDKPAKTTTKPKPAGDYHEVAKNETLSEIAAKYGLSVSDIAAWNNIENIDVIYTGQKLRLKAPEQPKAGDTVQVTSNNGLYIRNGAGLAYSVNSALNYGDVVKLLEVSNGWGKISRGWICLEYTAKV